MNKSSQKPMIKPSTLAKGAAGVAITAGAVAAGIYLAKGKNRKTAAKTLKKGFKSVGEITSNWAEEAEKMAPAIPHEIRSGMRKIKKRRIHKTGKK